MTDKDLIRLAFTCISRLYMNQKAIIDVFNHAGTMQDEEVDGRMKAIEKHFQDVKDVLFDDGVLKALE